MSRRKEGREVHDLIHAYHLLKAHHHYQLRLARSVDELSSVTSSMRYIRQTIAALGIHTSNGECTLQDSRRVFFDID